jgi:hypothetical protein
MARQRTKNSIFYVSLNDVRRQAAGIWRKLRTPCDKAAGHTGCGETAGNWGKSFSATMAAIKWRDKGRRITATKPQGTLNAAKPQGTLDATKPQGTLDAEKRQGTLDATKPQGTVNSRETAGHRQAKTLENRTEKTRLRRRQRPMLS